MQPWRGTRPEGAASRGALPRLRGRGKQGDALSNAIARAVLYHPAIEMIDLVFARWGRHPAKISTQSVRYRALVEDGLCHAILPLFTTASQARQRSTDELLNHALQLGVLQQHNRFSVFDLPGFYHL